MLCNEMYSSSKVHHVHTSYQFNSNLYTVIILVYDELKAYFMPLFLKCPFKICICTNLSTIIVV